MGNERMEDWLEENKQNVKTQITCGLITCFAFDHDYFEYLAEIKNEIEKLEQKIKKMKSGGGI